MERQKPYNYAKFGAPGPNPLGSSCCWRCPGFWIASRLPVWASIALALAFELFTLALIRDNLTLNVLMLVSPIDAIRQWQALG